MQYQQRLDEAERRFEELTAQMADPEVINDPAQYRKVTKAHSELTEIVTKYREWKTTGQNLEDARAMTQDYDADMRAMAEEEILRLEPQLAQIEEELKYLLLPKDPNDEKNVILEIRAGTGGDEATLFAAEIFRMYTRFAESRRWNVEVTSMSESAVGGLKEVIALVSGSKVYSQLKYESGVHRVQRVPETEQQGRVHTSAITVAVHALPALSDNEPSSVPRQNDHRAAPGPADGAPRRGLLGSNIGATRHEAAPLHHARGAAARARHRNCANSALPRRDRGAGLDPPVAKRPPD